MKIYVCFFLSFFIIPISGLAVPSFSQAHLEAFDVGNGGESLFCKVFVDEEEDFIRGRAFMLSSDYLYNAHLSNANLLYEPLPINLVTSSYMTHLNLQSVDFRGNVHLKNFINDLILENKLKPYANESELRILKLLEKNAPELYRNFKNFLFYKLNYIEGKNRVWIPVDELPLLHNENSLDVLTQSFCQQPTQVVIRVQKNGTIYYFYSWREMILLQHQKLQESFLFVHEWLWDFFRSAKQVREVNWFLHSKRAETLTIDEFRDELAHFGFDLNQKTEIDPVVEQSWKVVPQMNDINAKASSLTFKIQECGDPKQFLQQECKVTISSDHTDIDRRFVKLELIESNGHCFENQTWGLNKDQNDHIASVWTKKNCKAKFRFIYFTFKRIETILF